MFSIPVTPYPFLTEGFAPHPSIHYYSTSYPARAEAGADPSCDCAEGRAHLEQVVNQSLEVSLRLSFYKTGESTRIRACSPNSLSSISCFGHLSQFLHCAPNLDLKVGTKSEVWLAKILISVHLLLEYVVYGCEWLYLLETFIQSIFHHLSASISRKKKIKKKKKRSTLRNKCMFWYESCGYNSGWLYSWETESLF